MLTAHRLLAQSRFGSESVWVERIESSCMRTRALRSNFLERSSSQKLF